MSTNTSENTWHSQHYSWEKNTTARGCRARNYLKSYIISTPVTLAWATEAIIARMARQRGGILEMVDIISGVVWGGSGLYSFIGMHFPEDTYTWLVNQ